MCPGPLALTPPATVKDVGCLIAAFLILAVAFAGVGIVVHVLWVVAAIFFVCWVAGYAFARGRRRGSRARRWG